MRATSPTYRSTRWMFAGWRLTHQEWGRGPAESAINRWDSFICRARHRWVRSPIPFRLAAEEEAVEPAVVVEPAVAGAAGAEAEVAGQAGPVEPVGPVG